MKKSSLIITIGFVIALLSIVTYVWATASSETGDTRARPVTLYGKTSGGTLTALLVDSNGKLQLTTG